MSSYINKLAKMDKSELEFMKMKAEKDFLDDIIEIHQGDPQFMGFTQYYNDPFHEDGNVAANMLRKNYDLSPTEEMKDILIKDLAELIVTEHKFEYLLVDIK